MSISTVSYRNVANDEGDLRVDRWFKRHFPDLSHIRLEKLLRTGQVRVDGGRVKASDRVAPGQVIRIPPLQAATADHPYAKPAAPVIRPEDATMLHEAVLYMDDLVMVINKPPGLPTQGGTGITRHLDGMLDALRFDAVDRPRLVHRLDKDTSGVLLLGRTASATAALSRAFRGRTAEKLYWALTIGVPNPRQATIRAGIAKVGGPTAERMEVDDEEGQSAITDYSVVDYAGSAVAWVAFQPKTGRTHQIRVHAAFLGTPLVGDGKYGGAEAQLQGNGISKKLHLHARSIRVPHPNGTVLEVSAPLPEHMVASFKFFDFNPSASGAGFMNPDY